MTGFGGRAGRRRTTGTSPSAMLRAHSRWLADRGGRRANRGGADLEGANLAGADLRDADLTGCALSATRFFEVDAAGRERGARVEGLRLEGASGLLEDQERWLRARGVALPANPA